MTSKRIIAMLMAVLMLFSGMAVSASANTGDSTSGTVTTTPTFTKITLNSTNCKIAVDESNNIQILVDAAKITIDGTDYEVIFSATQKDDATKTLRRLVDPETKQSVFSNPVTGKTYTVQGYITIGENDYVASNAFNVEVLQSQSAPASPVPLKRTSTSITIKAVANCEYKIDDGEWVSTTTFENLDPETNYTVYMRYKYIEGKYYASEPSFITLKTLKASKGKAATPVLKDKTNNSITVFVEEGAEYSIDKGATWNKTGIFTNLKANSKYEIIARFIYDANTEDASPVSAALAVVTNSKANTLASKNNCKFEVTTEGNLYAKRSFSFKVTGDAPKDYGSVQFGDTRLIPVTYTVRMNGAALEKDVAFTADSKVNVKTGIATPTEKGTVEIEVTYRTEEYNGTDWVNTNQDKVASYKVEVGTEYNAAREFFVKIANFFLNTLPNLILRFMGTAK